MEACEKMAEDLERKLREIRDSGNASRDKGTQKALENAADILKQALEQNSDLAKNYSKVVSENENLRKENESYKQARKEEENELVVAQIKYVNGWGHPQRHMEIEILPQTTGTKFKPSCGTTNYDGVYCAKIPAGNYRVRAREMNFWGNPTGWKEMNITFSKDNPNHTIST